MRSVRLWFAALTLLAPLCAIDCAGDFVADQKATCKNGNLDKGETDVDCGGTGCTACEREKTCKLDSDCGSGLSCLADTRAVSGALRCQFTHCSDSKRNDNETDIDCGGSCWPCNADQKCKAPTDCESQVCTAGLCALASCTDNVKNQDEPDTDCGSQLTECPGCLAGKTCVKDANCASSVCDAGKCAQATCSDSRKNGDEGGVDCGGSCQSRCGQESPCNKDADCTSNVCRANICLSAACADDVRNGSESDIDCGGSCGSTCPDTAGCNANADCVHHFCNAHVCQTPTCDDHIRNQDEADIDCGDSAGVCVRCPPGTQCQKAASCDSNICTGGYCVARSCTDGTKNGLEADADCGGDCPKCDVGKTCYNERPSDCKEGVCTNNRCSAPICTDLVKNGSETDNDCGGPDCSTKCLNGKACRVNSDCAGNSCFGAVCELASCTNFIADGSETDVDCGGPDCRPCPATKKCAKDTDCLSLNCDDYVTFTCIPDACPDGVRNGTETAVDCGGSCPIKCDPGTACILPSDCLSGKCGSDKTCLAPTCVDGVKNGLETDIDCGGAVCRALAAVPLCADRQTCLRDADCQAGLVCNTATGVCVAWSCNDGRKNQDETDVDCGGNACRGTIKCTTGETCVVPADCKDRICDPADNTCASPLCTDTIKNGDEGGPDCGGVVCPPAQRCANGVTCNVGSDCQSGVCSLTSPQVCLAPTCVDKVKNGDETDVDCGGSCGKTCADGKVCKVIGDCVNTASKCSLSGAIYVCTPPGCGDSSLSPGETDVDCGGTSCAPCGLAKNCSLDRDCVAVVSGKCLAGKCAAPACTDLVKNGAESDVDCGGSGANGYPVCSACADGKVCSSTTDCTSKVCKGGLCAPPTCDDQTKNGGEIGIDCGSVCDANHRCATGSTCSVDADCSSGWCKSSVCTLRTCSDGILNGTEGDKDCGAICGDVNLLCKVSLNQACKADADCDSATCSECTGKCIYAPASCLKQGTGCAQCAVGTSCTTDFDCKSLSCDSVSKKCIAADNCPGQLLTATGYADGTAICGSNAGTNANCRVLLRCLFVNNCTLGTGCSTNNDGLCGANKLNIDSTPYTEATKAWTAAGCTSPTAAATKAF